ncbi:MAG: hypothetical protein WCR36_11025 [Bacteroidaceae bacterium]
MKYKLNDYFEGVPKIGNLSIDCIRSEKSSNIPELFFCVDDNQNLYICFCCEVSGTNKCLIAQTTIDKLTDQILKDISIRDIFRSSDGPCLIRKWIQTPYGEINIEYEELEDGTCFSDKYLPDQIVKYSDMAQKK